MILALSVEKHDGAIFRIVEEIFLSDFDLDFCCFCKSEHNHSIVFLVDSFVDPAEDIVNQITFVAKSRNFLENLSEMFVFEIHRVSTFVVREDEHGEGRGVVHCYFVNIFEFA